jgi:hypothetical protein
MQYSGNKICTQFLRTLVIYDKVISITSIKNAPLLCVFNGFSADISNDNFNTRLFIRYR